ncbi:FtsX-like permease family protein [Patescibacteria group bacterium]|nr:FtsX-like permease family protein [Patescibacteria group bacterium]MBU1951944.1 FtsX-like permease family protein [Patescibacteria group bacterium]
MKFSYINKINLKKLKLYRGKSLFLIIPITLLMTLGVLISSQSANIMTASEDVILGTAKEQSRLIELSSVQTAGGPGQNEDFVRMIRGGSSDYKTGDLETVKTIDNVEAASLNVAVPIDRVITEDIYTGNAITLNSIKGINEDLAALYTEEDFHYITGEPIPIILNANSLTYQYEDWAGRDEVAIDFTQARPSRGMEENIENIQNNLPFKTEAVTYEKDELVGSEIMIEFGGLGDVQSFEQEFTGSGILFRKLTDEQIQTAEQERADAIGKYWDYQEIKTPLAYTFKVVGILENDTNFSTYIPDQFASLLVKNYIQNQIDSRNDAEISTDELNSTYTGLTYDGLELNGGGNATIGGIGGVGSMMRSVGGPNALNQDTQQEIQASYSIPGLVIETEREEGDTDAFRSRIFGGSGTVIGIYPNASVFDEAVKSSDTMLIKISNTESRNQVVKDLNDLGFAYQDLNDLEVFSELQSTLNNVTSILTISFIILSAIIIILTMGKFVSDSKKEIGVFRAIGATKRDIKQLFMSQAIMYTLIGYLLGSILGVSFVLLISKPVQLWFDSFIKNTVEETFAVVQHTSAGTFAGIDWQMFGVYTVLLIVIAVIVSIIPATRASKISPVQAISNE